MEERGVERAQFALSALLEGNRSVATPDQAADLAIETWNLLLSAPNARTLLADIPAAEMVALRDWMVESIAREADLPLPVVQASLDVRVWRSPQVSP